MVTVEYSEAAVEALGILNTLNDMDFNKIPNEVINFLEKNKSESYNPDIDYYASNENLKIKDKTRQILAGIYLDYLCPESEKDYYKNKLRQNEITYQEKIKKEYNYDNLFNRKNTGNIENITSNETSLATIKKEGIFAKIINRLKIFFD